MRKKQHVEGQNGVQVALEGQFEAQNGVQVAPGAQFGGANGVQVTLGGQFERPKEMPKRLHVGSKRGPRGFQKEVKICLQLGELRILMVKEGMVESNEKTTKKEGGAIPTPLPHPANSLPVGREKGRGFANN